MPPETNSHHNTGAYQPNDRPTFSGNGGSGTSGGHRKGSGDNDVPPLVLSTKSLIDAIITKTIKNPVDKGDNLKSSRGLPPVGGPRPPPETIDITADGVKPEDSQTSYKKPNNFVVATSSSSAPPPPLPSSGKTYQNHLSGRSLTLGEGINAIINQEYLSEGRNISNRVAATSPVAAASAALVGAGNPPIDSKFIHGQIGSKLFNTLNVLFSFLGLLS